jgi:hypothetical protein
MGLMNNLPNAPAIYIAVGAEFDLEIKNNGLDPKGEAHALMTLIFHVQNRMRELYPFIADAGPEVEPCQTV